MRPLVAYGRASVHEVPVLTNSSPSSAIQTNAVLTVSGLTIDWQLPSYINRCESADQLYYGQQNVLQLLTYYCKDWNPLDWIHHPLLDIVKTLTKINKALIPVTRRLI